MDKYIQKAFNPEYFERGKIVIIKIKKDFTVNAIFENRNNVSKAILGVLASVYIGIVYKCSYDTLDVAILGTKNGRLADICMCTFNASDLDKFEIYGFEELYSIIQFQ